MPALEEKKEAVVRLSLWERAFPILSLFAVALGLAIGVGIDRLLTLFLAWKHGLQ